MKRKSRRQLAAWLAASLFPGGASCLPVHAAESARLQEVLECRAGEIQTWGDGVDRPARRQSLLFVYYPAGAPDFLYDVDIGGMVSKAGAAWSLCGIPVKSVYANQLTSGGPKAIRVEWNEAESRGNFALANLGQETLSLSARAFRMLRERNPQHDARETLQMVISHEMGHFFGLMAHSRRCVDVLSYYDNGKGEKCFKRIPGDSGGVVEYRSSFPTACDIARCRQVNGFSAP